MSVYLMPREKDKYFAVLAYPLAYPHPSHDTSHIVGFHLKVYLVTAQQREAWHGAYDIIRDMLIGEFLNSAPPVLRDGNILLPDGSVWMKVQDIIDSYLAALKLKQS